MSAEEQEENGPFWGSWEKTVVFDSAKATVRTIVSVQGSKAFVVGLEPGQELRSHLAPADLYLLIVEGNVTLAVADQVKPASFGDCVLMKKGVPHSIYNNGTNRAAVVGITI